jgi:hypothetical protein
VLRGPNLLGSRSLTRPKSFTLDVGVPWDIKKSYRETVVL